MNVPVVVGIKLFVDGFNPNCFGGGVYKSIIF